MAAVVRVTLPSVTPPRRAKSTAASGAAERSPFLSPARSNSAGLPGSRRFQRWLNAQLILARRVVDDDAAVEDGVLASGGARGVLGVASAESAGTRASLARLFESSDCPATAAPASASASASAAASARCTAERAFGRIDRDARLKLRRYSGAFVEVFEDALLAFARSGAPFSCALLPDVSVVRQQGADALVLLMRDSFQRFLAKTVAQYQGCTFHAAADSRGSLVTIVPCQPRAERALAAVLRDAREAAAARPEQVHALQRHVHSLQEQLAVIVAREQAAAGSAPRRAARDMAAVSSRAARMAVAKVALSL